MNDPDNLQRLLSERRSCRGFRPDAVPGPTLRRLFDLAQHTPSWCNTQPWQVHVTSGAATEKLRQALLGSSGSRPDLEFPPQYTGIRQTRRREVGWQLYASVGVRKGDREASARESLRNFQLFGAPHAVIISTAAELGVYGAVDAGLYVQSLLLAAQSLGLATCAQAALAARAPLLHDFFGIPEDEKIVCGISLGYADPGHPANAFRAGRAHLDEAVTFHT